LSFGGKSGQMPRLGKRTVSRMILAANSLSYPDP